MRKYLFIGIGGVAGAILRYLIKEAYMPGENFPLSTLFINVIGCFLLALILTIALDNLAIHPDLRLGIATGFLGAFTTFSTFCKETVNLFYKGHHFLAISNIAISTILGFAAAYFGVVLARKIIESNHYEKEDNLLKKSITDESEDH